MQERRRVGKGHFGLLSLNSWGPSVGAEAAAAGEIQMYLFSPVLITKGRILIILPSHLVIIT